MTDIIGSDNPFSTEVKATLQKLAGLMVPPSEEYSVPGAADDSIFTDFLATGAHQAEALHEAATLIDELAGGSLTDANATESWSATEKFCQSPVLAARTYVALLMQCYYRDDRVMASLGLEVRAPHPQGYEVEEGDWSLLDPVTKRGNIYKEV